MRYRQVECPRPVESFAEHVRVGLTTVPKRLPCRYFYDAEGSRLFEAICELPEYYLPECEREILSRHATEIAAASPVTVLELGSGNAAKTRILLSALLARHARILYVPIDVSKTALETSSHALLADYPGLDVLAACGEYEEGLAAVHIAQPKLVLWLGSNIGNLDRQEAAEFLRRLSLAPGDRLLCGIDLRKDRAILERAYDDTKGVTAAFNRNILVRINRELGGRFDVASFAHRAIYDEADGRVDMYLVSRDDQRVHIDGLANIPFSAGEAIHTESSYKYSPSEIRALADQAGLTLSHAWMDGQARFCVAMFQG